MSFDLGKRSIVSTHLLLNKYHLINLVRRSINLFTELAASHINGFPIIAQGINVDFQDPHVCQFHHRCLFNFKRK